MTDKEIEAALWSCSNGAGIVDGWEMSSRTVNGRQFATLKVEIRASRNHHNKVAALSRFPVELTTPFSIVVVLERRSPRMADLIETIQALSVADRIHVE